MSKIGQLKAQRRLEKKVEKLKELVIMLSAYSHSKSISAQIREELRKLK